MSFLTPDEYEYLTNFIYRRTGLRFETKKHYFLSKKIQKRLDELRLETVADYIRKLRFSDPDQSEFQRLLNLLTINETYFFRDFPQFQAFAEHCLPEVTQRKQAAGDRKIRIWSAGCASGEEPYTIAIILNEMLDNPKQWEIEIVANDVDIPILEQAKKAVYHQRSIRDVPPEYLERYFIKKEHDYILTNEIKRMVNFEYLNLSNKLLIRKRTGFDFIFCRNVLIYFDDNSRKQLVDHFYVALNPEGYIFLGSSESVGRITTAFKIKRLGGHLVYYKPKGDTR